VGEGGGGAIRGVLMPPLLETCRLDVLRGGRHVLRDVTVAVAAGEILAVVGPNGAGKSTWLLACLGLLPFEGRIELDGRPLGSYTPRERARRMAYVPQADPRPIPFTAAEFVRLGRYPYWTGLRAPGRADAAVAREALALTDTARFADRAMSTLSGGERQRVHIAAALAQEPALLLLDEPTAFLDPRHQAETAALLGRLNRERGLGIVLVTHDLNLGAACAHRVLALRDGTVAYLGVADGFLHPGVLESLYEVPFDVTLTASGTRRAFARVPS
jgi:iron complex transport system ATP-binding protein